MNIMRKTKAIAKCDATPFSFADVEDLDMLKVLAVV